MNKKIIIASVAVGVLLIVCVAVAVAVLSPKVTFIALQMISRVDVDTEIVRRESLRKMSLEIPSIPLTTRPPTCWWRTHTR